jgi:hypothetical protein
MRREITHFEKKMSSENLSIRFKKAEKVPAHA